MLLDALDYSIDKEDGGGSILADLNYPQQLLDFCANELNIVIEKVVGQQKDRDYLADSTPTEIMRLVFKNRFVRYSTEPKKFLDDMKIDPLDALRAIRETGLYSAKLLDYRYLVPLVVSLSGENFMRCCGIYDHKTFGGFVAALQKDM